MKRLLINSLFLLSFNVFAQDPCAQYTPEVRNEILIALDSFEIEMVEKGYLQNRTPEGYLNFILRYAPKRYEEIIREPRTILDTSAYSLLIGPCKYLLTDPNDLEEHYEWRIENAFSQKEIDSISAYPESAGVIFTRKLTLKTVQPKFAQRQLMLQAASLMLITSDLKKVGLPTLIPNTANDDEEFEFELNIELDSLNNIFVDNQISNLTEVKSKAYHFVQSHPLNGEIRLHAHRKSLYKTYIELLDELNGVYRRAYDEKSQNLFAKNFEELSDHQRKEVKSHLAKRIDVY